jgi:hypothetical protein
MAKKKNLTPSVQEKNSEWTSEKQQLDLPQGAAGWATVRLSSDGNVAIAPSYMREECLGLSGLTTVTIGLAKAVVTTAISLTNPHATFSPVTCQWWWWRLQFLSSFLCKQEVLVQISSILENSNQIS